MSFTRGGKKRRKHFDWYYDSNLQRVQIVNEDGREHEYSLAEIQSIIKTIHKRFGTHYFPLANNVEKLSNGTEHLGLGTIILELSQSTIAHAQGASYLGVVLEECGFLMWNGKYLGIAWKLLLNYLESKQIESCLIRKSQPQ